jgi:hypothetical protein
MLKPIKNPRLKPKKKNLHNSRIRTWFYLRFCNHNRYYNIETQWLFLKNRFAPWYNPIKDLIMNNLSIPPLKHKKINTMRQYYIYGYLS